MTQHDKTRQGEGKWTNWTFGELNNMGAGPNAPKLDVNDSTVWGNLRKVGKKAYDYDFFNRNEWVGYVLRIEDLQKATEPNSWFSKIFTDPPDTPIQVKVRIPEVHVGLPEPTGPEDHYTIDMYPTFVGKDAIANMFTNLKVGDPVRVGFGNQDTQEEPQLIGPVQPQDTSNTVPPGPPGAGSQSFGCSGGTNIQKPVGESVKGENKVRSDSGPNSPDAPAVPEGFEAAKGTGKVALIVPKETTRDNTKAAAIKWRTGLKKHDQLKGKMVFAELESALGFTAFYAPSTTKWDIPVEIIFYFNHLGTGGTTHGSNTYPNFKKEVVPQLKSMVDEERNFLIVIPELPEDGFWLQGADFTSFYNQARLIISQNWPNRAQGGFTDDAYTLYAHNRGGPAIDGITYQLTGKKFNKIILSQADWGALSTSLWNDYVKSDTKVKMHLLVENNPSDKPAMETQAFWDSLTSPKPENVKFEKLNKKPKDMAKETLLVGDFTNTKGAITVTPAKDATDGKVPSKHEDKSGGNYSPTPNTYTPTCAYTRDALGNLPPAGPWQGEVNFMSDGQIQAMLGNPAELDPKRPGDPFLSENFSFKEFIKSDTAAGMAGGMAAQRGEGLHYVNNMRHLCRNILEPIRAQIKVMFGENSSVRISSGFRSVKVAKAISKGHGSNKSQHRFGQAADFSIRGAGGNANMTKLWKWICDNRNNTDVFPVGIGSAILEKVAKSTPNRVTHIHVAMIARRIGADPARKPATSQIKNSLMSYSAKTRKYKHYSTYKTADNKKFFPGQWSRVSPDFDNIPGYPNRPWRG